jgi:hypothetical protein
MWLQIDLIVPDPEVLRQELHPCDSRLGPPQLPIGKLRERHPDSRGKL